MAYKCVDCGVIYIAKPPSTFCKDCQLKHNKEHKRLYRARVGWVLNDRCAERLGTSNFKSHICRNSDGTLDLVSELEEVEKEMTFQFEVKKKYFGMTNGDKVRGFYP